MNKKTEKILSKIRKMLAMAERTEGNEAEAANAARMAEALMRKHNLTIVDMTPEQAKSDVLKDLYKEMKWTAGKCPVWVNVLAIATADCYDSFCVFTKAESNDDWVAKAQQHISFVGNELDVAVTMEMFVYLYKTVNRLTDEHFKVYPAPKGKARSEKMGYRTGMARRLREKLGELQREKEAELQEATKTGTGLVVVKKDAIAAFLGHGTEYGRTNRQTNNSSASYRAGYAKGGSVSLNKQLN